MKTDIFNHFEALRADSRVRVSQPVIHGFHEISNSKGEAGKELIKAELVANGQWRWRLEGGSQAIRDKSAHSSWRKVKEFSEFDEGAHIERLNAALQGGRNYPILSLLSGVIIGAASAGMGLLFSAASTGVSMSKVSNRVLARPGDQLWKVEEVGKVRSGNSYKVVHVLSFFIIDPFRDSSRFRNRGWLIHEERTDVELG